MCNQYKHSCRDIPVYYGREFSGTVKVQKMQPIVKTKRVVRRIIRKQYDWFEDKLRPFMQRLIRRIFWTYITITVGFLAYIILKDLWNGSPIVYEAVNEAKAEEVYDVPPVMQRIAGCESEGSPKKSGRQFDDKGNVVRGWVDKNDIGKYQISLTHHGVAAKKLGYDVYTENGNEGFAMYLYKTQGTEPWFKSKKCWR